ncbi:HtaA domain-containing protein [Streptomyces sp. NPDC090493]|uniref:HtaA domain-containing protein n=1 Tax=Streptomyces sp. NPDC090493 TaxID=3365964 RepID=UPI003812B700
MRKHLHRLVVDLRQQPLLEHLGGRAVGGDTGAFTASFAGCNFVGHREANGAYRLDLTLSRPTVRISGPAGTLYLDVTSKAKGTGTVTTSTQVPFASLALGGVGMKGAGAAVVLNNVPATLTAQGARSFAGYYTAGTALDPVSLRAPWPPPRSSRSPSAGAVPARRPAPPPPPTRTDPHYVVGSVAQGRIAVSGGAAQAAGNGAFAFGDATGDYDTDAGTLAAAFDGAVTFKGHESNGTYGLDLTFGNLRATFDDGRGELTADVTSLGTTTKDVELADLKAASADLTATDDVVTLDGVTATLTEAGAKAFSGYYPAGTALDPLDLSVALTDDAQLPSGDDGSTGTPTAAASDTTGAASGGVASTTGGTGGTGDALAATGSALPATALGAAAAVTAAAGAGVVYAMRRRRTEG